MPSGVSLEASRGSLGALGASWRPLRDLLRHLLGLLGASWGFLGASWAPAGRLGGPLTADCSKYQIEFPLFGPSCGPPGPLFGNLGAVLGPS